ncbi:MAG: hypothetical protein ACYTFK_08335 [Planctomycetota bacterium]|jgi:hypothetical protein
MDGSYKSITENAYANGFESKTIDTRMGKNIVAVPQVRGDIADGCERQIRWNGCTKRSITWTLRPAC